MSLHTDIPSRHSQGSVGVHGRKQTQEEVGTQQALRGRGATCQPSKESQVTDTVTYTCDFLPSCGF